MEGCCVWNDFVEKDDKMVDFGQVCTEKYLCIK